MKIPGSRVTAAWKRTWSMELEETIWRCNRSSDRSKKILRSACGSFLIMTRNIAAHDQMNRPSRLSRGNAFFCTSSITLDEQFAIIKAKDRAEIGKETKEVNVRSAEIHANSSHRDGSIYKNSYLRRICHVTNRDETQLEPMQYSDPTDCFPDQERCCVHFVCNMMQFFSLKLAKVSMNTSLVEIYGYIAVQDAQDLQLNYIVNHSRDHPIAVKQQSVGSTATSAPTLKRNSDDMGWEFGVLCDPDDLQRVKCKLCAKEMGGGISRMKQHVGQIKGQVTSCIVATKDQQKRCKDSCDSAKLKKKLKLLHEEEIRAAVNLERQIVVVEENGNEEELGSIGKGGSHKTGPIDQYVYGLPDQQQHHQNFKGSLIEMTGPKRGIEMFCEVLVEFDTRIKIGEQKEDDLQLIDGVVEYDKVNAPFHPFTDRINGDFGAVDITLACIPDAVEATIDVSISKVESGFGLSLSSLVFTGGSHEEIELFCGITDESCGLPRRHVIAVQEDTWMHLKVKVGQEGSTYEERYCHFEANIHSGCACQEIMLEHASMSIKVTWSIILH